MDAEQNYSGADSSMATQAIVELTEANLPAGSGEAEWAEELAFLSGSTPQDRISPAEVDEVIDLSTLLA